MQNYELLGLIGEGSFGRVYKAKFLKTGTNVAVKIIRKVCKLNVALFYNFFVDHNLVVLT